MLHCWVRNTQVLDSLPPGTRKVLGSDRPVPNTQFLFETLPISRQLQHGIEVSRDLFRLSFIAYLRIVSLIPFYLLLLPCLLPLSAFLFYCVLILMETSTIAETSLKEN